VSDGVNLGVGLDFDHLDARLVGDVTTNGDSGEVGVRDFLNGREIGVPRKVRLVVGEHIALAIGADVIDGRERALNERAGSRSGGRSNARATTKVAATDHARVATTTAIVKARFVMPNDILSAFCIIN